MAFPVLALDNTGVSGGGRRYRAPGVLYVDEASGAVGIGTPTPDVNSKLHVVAGASGATPPTNADDFIVEVSGSGGESRLTGAGGVWRMNFGDPGDATINRIISDHTGGFFDFETGNQTFAVRITSAQRVGIGTQAPAGPLNVVFSTAVDWILQENGLVNHMRWNDAPTAAPRYSFRRARGTSAAPLAVLADDIIGRVEGEAYDGAAFSLSSAVEIRFDAAENWTGAARGTRMRFFTTPNGAITQSERMRIDNAGNLLLGIATSPGGSPDGVLVLGTKTLGSALADAIQITSADRAAGNTTIAMRTEGTPITAAAGEVLTELLHVFVNGVEKRIGLFEAA